MPTLRDLEWSQYDVGDVLIQAAGANCVVSFKYCLLPILKTDPDVNFCDPKCTRLWDTRYFCCRSLT